MSDRDKLRADLEALRKSAFFACQNESCACEVSYHADQLAVAPNGEPICEDCWGEDAGKIWQGTDEDDDPPDFCDLPAFDPFAFVLTLTAERNVMQHEMGRLQTKACGAVDAAREIQRERDAALAEVERLRDALEGLIGPHWQDAWEGEDHD